MLPRRPLALVLALLCACSGNSETTTEDASSSTGPGPGSSSSTTDEPTTAGPSACDPVPETTADCCCLELDVAGGSLTNRCPTEQLCPAVEIACSIGDPECPVPGGGDTIPGAATVTDPAALDCILTALRDATPGSVTWTFKDIETGMKRRTEIRHIQANRDAFSLVDERVGTDGKLGDLVLGALRPAGYFDKCLGESDIKARAICLAKTADGVPMTTCAMGGEYSDAD